MYGREQIVFHLDSISCTNFYIGRREGVRLFDVVSDKAPKVCVKNNTEDERERQVSYRGLETKRFAKVF